MRPRLLLDPTPILPSEDLVEDESAWITDAWARIQVKTLLGWSSRRTRP